MSAPSTDAIRWRAWAAGLAGLSTRVRADGAMELRYADELAIASSAEQADAYLHYWQARRDMKTAGCAGPPQKADLVELAPTFRLELTRLPASRRQLALFPSRR